MKFYSKVLGLSMVIVFCWVFAFSVHAKEITEIKLFINPTTISTTNSQVGYSGVITGNFQELQTTCGQTGSIRWSVYDSGVGTSASGNIPVANFSTGTSQNITANTFNANTAGSRTAITYFLSLDCNGKALGTSDHIPVTITRPSSGGSLDNYNFSATPNSLDPGTTGMFTFILRVTAKQVNVENKCGTSPILLNIYSYPVGSLTVGVQKNKVQTSGSSGIAPSEFGTGKTLTRTLTGSITSTGKDFNIEGQLTCANGNQIGLSSPVKIVSGGLDVGGGGCGTSGQPACKPGETKTYGFDLTENNPLKGGASDFTSLVKIIAQWIFNLAIPIAVAMIVYAGILFLTAAGESAKVTKAKDVLKYAVIGLAIILIGSGFVTLIQSILELGGPSGAEQNQNLDSIGPQLPTTGNPGSLCNKDNNCVEGLKCKNTICQRANGNFVGEACVGGVNCVQGLACDLTTEAQQVIDGQALGSCFQPNGPVGQ